MSLASEVPRASALARSAAETTRWRDRNRMLDEASTGLATVIADLEANAFERPLGDWLGWILTRREAGRLVVAVGAPDAEEAAEFCADPDVLAAAETAANAGVELRAVGKADELCAQPFVLGALRRDCAGMIWLGPPSSVDWDLAALFAEAALGVTCAYRKDSPAARAAPRGVRILKVAPEAAPATIIQALLPEGAAMAATVSAAAQGLRDLMQAVQAEHARESAKLGQQSAAADRGRGGRGAPEALLARRSMLTEMREHLSRDLQERLQDQDHDPADNLRRTSFSSGVEAALDDVPALALAPRSLVRSHAFQTEELPVWWMGSPWEVFSFALDHKLRLSLPAGDLDRLCGQLGEALSRVVEKNARRRIKAFNASLDHFIEPAADLGVDLTACRIESDLEARWRVGVTRSGSVRSLSHVPLEDRCGQVIGQVRAKDLERFHVDLERRGFTGRMMQARTAVFGLSFLVTLFIRIQPALVPAQAHPAPRDAVHSSVSILTWVTVAMLGLGFVVMLLTGGRKEDAVLTEKVSEARDALAEKLVASMDRFVGEENDLLQAMLAERRTMALERLGRGVDAAKEQIDEVERRGRATSPGRPARGTLAALPVGLRTVQGRLGDLVREVRLEMAAAALAQPSAPKES